MTTANLQHLIQRDPHATTRVLRYLDDLRVEHSGEITGSTLARVCDVSSRRWRDWEGGARTMPAGARRLLELVSGVSLPWITLPWDPDGEGKPLPRGLRHEHGDAVIVRLANGHEQLAWWRQRVGSSAGWYYDADGEPLEAIAVLSLGGWRGGR